MSTGGVLEMARSLHVRGRLAEAESLYREVLTSEPDALPALAALGVLVYQRGRADEAAEFFARGVRLRPELAGLRANLGEALRIVGDREAAADHLRTALALDPDQPDAWNSRGLLAHDRGDHAGAEASFREAIRLRPGFASAHINLGNALCELGRPDEAAGALRSALRLEPGDAAAMTGLARVLIETEDPDVLDEAEALCRGTLERAPGMLQATNNLGNVLRLRGRYDEAAACYRAVLRADPRRVAPRLNWGRLLQDFGRYDDAAAMYEEAEALAPDPSRFHANLGGLAAGREDHEEAARRYRRALELGPATVGAHLGLGQALMELGRFEAAGAEFRAAIRLRPLDPAPRVALARLQSEAGDAEAACRSARSALEHRPGCSDAYCVLANQLRGRLPDDDLRAMTERLDRPDPDDGRRARLGFALGLVLDGRGLHGRAAGVLADANARQAAARAARGQGYDPDEHSRLVDRLIAAFPGEPGSAARCGPGGGPDPRPIFVVGLPRSGTTLVEQILASHPAVHGAGELPDVLRIFGDLPEIVGRPWEDPVAALRGLDEGPARVAARRYLDRLGALAPPSAVRVVDKMPDNVLHLGLIARLWPGARVIVCHRDLRDIAVSCWQTGFSAIRWANDPDHIARRLADHRRLLEHWDRIRPVARLDVSYEEVVGDVEGQARRLVAFAGLEWDPACLAFHETRRVVRTASLAQVRRPIYSRSVGRWRAYEPHVPALFEALRRRGIAPDGEGGGDGPAAGG